MRDGNSATLIKSSLDIGSGVQADNAVAYDGVNYQKTASLTNLQAFLSQNAMMSIPPGESTVTASIVTGTTTPTATLAAPGANKIYVVRWISISLAATLDQVPLLFKLIQDTGGTPLTLWQGALAALAKGKSSLELVGLCTPQTVANKALDLSVVTGTIVSTNYITVSFGAVIAA